LQLQVLSTDIAGIVDEMEPASSNVGGQYLKL
jgi:hypothetical protein